jgi:ATP-dependent protease ClpP protease subunit
VFGDDGILINYSEEVLEFSRRDRWYNSDEALNFGLVDEVKIFAATKF